MAADLVLMDDGLTVEFGNSDECSDLTAQEAEAVTGRIRRWVNDFPVADVVLAFRGRVWIALAYASWAEWCECELGGLKLPAPKRREVVAELAGEGMSNVAIGSALNVDEGTVRNDRRSAGSENSEAERKRRGQDGKDYSSPHPKPTAPPPEIVVDAEIVCRDCYGNGCETCFPEDEPATDEQIAAMAEMSDDEFEAALSAARADGDLSAGNVIKHGQQADDLQSDEVPQRKSPEPPITKSFSTANYRLTLAVKAVVRLSENDRFKKNKDQISGCHLSDLIRARDALAGVIQQLEG
ncbi:Uncharacterised protein [Mycobacteroides abscessus subsp. abscessus]|uniref:hypothetical protein n=1 Tax=Mycobacteroides abscessus TaxID=36809 RepID=UPI0008A909F9|nr:hypothetical protein [Mycobacteroides abscessus]OHU67437.1 hypothetical protein BKG87_22375 [Mycobacteroides chelonae]SII78549.1 Uncharacterised protein [Mycobacteroides abscessus subsp. abscessus]SII84380.1 Uncharacterised protein [Mycobacteroides abscessus subsp. abscessus]SIL60905.1 Uncharacterised protein [Mycobacteroides abscessus subsp. abscessus]SKT17102.1 Uncharacterised protein [Mycobacteroides abscessus subsp. abscessus]